MSTGLLVSAHQTIVSSMVQASPLNGMPCNFPLVVPACSQESGPTTASWDASELPASMLSKTGMAGQFRAQQMSTCISTLASGGSDNIVGAGWGRAQAGEGPRGQLGVVSCGMQGQAVKTSFLQGPCGVCSAQGELWFVCHQSMGMRVCALFMAYQTGHGIANILLAAAQALGLC